MKLFDVVRSRGADVLATILSFITKKWIRSFITNLHCEALCSKEKNELEASMEMCRYIKTIVVGVQKKKNEIITFK